VTRMSDHDPKERRKNELDPNTQLEKLPSAPQNGNPIRYRLNVSCRLWPNLTAHVQRMAPSRPS
jgi:hypothetical protein